MGLSTEVWGKEGWRFVHSVALSYPLKPTKEDKENYLNFFKSLQYVLPCPICADNFKKKIEKTPPNLENRKTLFHWTVDAHNEVNKENGKKIFTYDEAFDSIYEEIKKEQQKYNLNMKRLMIIEDVKTILPYMALSVFFSYVITRKTK